jgi:uncharacterized membrane protein
MNPTLHTPMTFQHSAIAAALLTLHAVPALAEVSFQVTPIAPTAGFTHTFGRALNNRGDVVGELRQGGSGPFHAFVLRNGVLTDLGNAGFGNGLSSAQAINDAGLVVGHVRDAANNALPAVWQPGSTTPTLLSTQFGTADAVNASGQVLGTLTGTPGNFNPSVFRSNGAGLATALPGAVARDLNDAGTFTGALFPAGGPARAVRVTAGGLLRNLPALSSALGDSIGIAINGRDEVAGVSVDAQGRQRAVRWNAAGQVLNLGVLGEINAKGAPPISTSTATALNEAGVVVGHSSSGSAVNTAFYWTERAGMQHLPLASGGVAPIAATALNELGQVLAHSATGAVLLTPSGRLFWGGGSGSFADGARWNPTASSGLAGRFDFGMAPNRFLDATLLARNPDLAASSQVVTVDRSTALRSLALGGGSSQGSVELRLSGTASARTQLDLTNLSFVQAGGVLSGSGDVNGRLSVTRSTQGAGRIAAVDLRVSGPLSNAGDIVSGAPSQTAGLLAANVDNLAPGRVSAGRDSQLQLNGDAHTNRGLFEANGVRSELRVFGSLQNLASGTVLAREGRVLLNGRVTNEGLLRAGPRGELRIANALVHNGSAVAEIGGRMVFEGTVSGAGSFTGDGSFEFLGGFAPGNSPALVEVGHALFAAGDIVLDLGGAQPGAAHDQLRFTGNVRFAPGVALRLQMDGFQVQQGDRFQLFDFTQGVSGNLDFGQLPVLGGGLRWDTGQVLSQGWLGVSAVPEPHTGLLLLAGLPWVAKRRRTALV